MKILSVVGTRPNFIKISALIDEIKKNSIEHALVHTGQHYDKEMSRLFFYELAIPKPDINLGVGSGTYAEQTGKILIEIEKVLIREKPDLVIVVGDVNSTLAAALAAKQLGIKVAHVEAGLRSFDMSMPEEINRMLTDRISDFLFTTEESANRNLLMEGIKKEKIFFVGNVMIDTLLKHKIKSSQSKILSLLRLEKKEYCVVTLHRPSNVDAKEGLKKVISIIDDVQKETRVVFPVHPRTRKNLETFGLYSIIKGMKNVTTTEPLGYLNFIRLMSDSKFVLTDSGGIQEETTILQVPCITFRENTERPITIKSGTNLLVSTNPAKVTEVCQKIINGKVKLRKKAPEYWDGEASKRIIGLLKDGIKSQGK